MTIPTDDVFFSKTEKGKPDVKFLKDHFYREGRIKEEHALYIIDGAMQLLRTEPNVLTINCDDSDPVKICGSTFGQYYDLMKLFEAGGHPCFTRYLFLGDYVYKGHLNIECLLYLWALKIWYPNTFFLLRGPHEGRRVSECYTFEIECKHKYSERVYEAFLESFNTLPLVAIVAKRYFCVNGGISPDLHTIDDIRKLNRFCEPPNSGIMRDILWSQPIKSFGHERTTEYFLPTSAQRASYFYTYKAVCDFLERNRLVSIIRAHQLPKRGYATYRKHLRDFSLITITSAPDWDGFENRAVVLSCYGEEYIVQQFDSSPHLHRLPTFMDAFSWSLPFICEKVMDMLAVVLYIYFLELRESIENSTPSVAGVDCDKPEVGLLVVLHNKILAVRCISYIFSVFRVGSEHVSEINTFLRSSSLRDDVASLRVEDIKKAIRSLNEARILNDKPLTYAPLPLSNAKDSAGERVASASMSTAAGATPMTLLMRTKEGGELVAKELNAEVQDREVDISSRKAAVSKKEVLHRPEEACLSSEHFEASVRHAEASPKMPEEPFIITETSRQQDEPPGTSHYQPESRTNGATGGIQEIEKQLQEMERCLQIREAEVQGGEAVLRVKERHLQIREADVQDVEKVLQVKERDLQIRKADVEKVLLVKERDVQSREADVQDVEKNLRVKERDLQNRESEVQKTLQAINERREAMDLQEDNLRQQLAAMKEWEENLRLKEAALTQQMTTARQPNRDGAACESDLFSISSFSTIRNSPRIHTNVDLKSHAGLKEDSEYHSNE